MYADTKDGRVFSQSSTPLGLAIPIYTATAIVGGMPIWNPPNSGVDVELVSVTCERASGTADFGAIGVIGRQLLSIATGTVMTAMASTTAVNGSLFRGQSSRVFSSNAGTCTVSAGAASDWVRTLFSINLEADTGTAHATNSLGTFRFNGSLVVPPGTLVYLAATKASVALYASTIVWVERLLA